MYICICNAIREKDIRSAARCQAGGAEDIYGSMGYRPQCRQCLEDAEDIIADERARTIA
ncbi:MAG: (2Fe-2S)-binding protein [Novosphingobium sp.]|nr:(2Fe-2S)-binding protein [Novosphingobium sp.]